MMEDVRYTDGFSEHPEDHEQEEAPGLQSSSEEDEAGPSERGPPKVRSLRWPPKLTAKEQEAMKRMNQSTLKAFFPPLVNASSIS